jgi:hypothetical protein
MLMNDDIFVFDIKVNDLKELFVEEMKNIKALNAVCEPIKEKRRNKRVKL